MGESHFVQRLAPLSFHSGSAHSAHTTASIVELACVYLALILHDHEVLVTENKINALIKAVGVNAEPFCPGLFAKGLANVNMGSFICNVRLVDLPQQLSLHQQEVLPLHHCAPAEEKKVEAKKEESDADMGFVLFD